MFNFISRMFIVLLGVCAIGCFGKSLASDPKKSIR